MAVILPVEIWVMFIFFHGLSGLIKTNFYFHVVFFKGIKVC